jgi:ATP synthase protein I
MVGSNGTRLKVAKVMLVCSCTKRGGRRRVFTYNLAVCRNQLPINPMSERHPRSDSWDEESQEEKDAVEQSFQPLTSEQAQALRATQPSVSPWRVVATQAVVGFVAVLLAGLWSGERQVVWSALIGMATVVLPGALMVCGMRRLPAQHAGAALLGFAVWEFVKVLLAVAMLAAAAMWVPHLNWPALLVTLVVCTKASWVVLLRQGRVKQTP